MNLRNSLYVLVCNLFGFVGGFIRFMKILVFKGVGFFVRKNGFYRLGFFFINFRRLKWFRFFLKFCRSCIYLLISFFIRIEVIKLFFDFKFSIFFIGYLERLIIVLYFGLFNRLFMFLFV